MELDRMYSPLSANVQRKNLRSINPRNTVDRSAEDQHVQEEEGNGRRSCGLLDGSPFEGKQDGDHHH